MKALFCILFSSLITTSISFTSTRIKHVGRCTTGDLKFARPPRLGMASAEDAVNAINSLYGKTLLSVPECIEAFKNNEVLKIDDSSSSTSSRVVFIDSTWWHKGKEVDAGRKEYERGPRIKGSFHIDMDDLCSDSDLPHMLPTKDFFEMTMNYYGISNNDHIIITARDESVYFTPRTWFLFRTFGHDAKKLHLMQGSLQQWIDLGGEVDDSPAVIPLFQELFGNNEIQDSTTLKELYIAKPSTNVVDKDHMIKTINANKEGKKDGALILDSRGSSFAAKGHMPGAIHLPYAEWVQTTNAQVWKTTGEIMKIFKAAGIDPLSKQNIVCSCGTGVSVCHTLLALSLCGRDLDDEEFTTVMYDGSWAEYGKDPNTEKVLYE